MGLLRVVGCQLSYERLHSTRHSNSCILHHLFNTVSFSEDSTAQDISQSSSTCSKTAMHVPPAIINQSYILLTIYLLVLQTACDGFLIRLQDADFNPFHPPLASKDPMLSCKLLWNFMLRNISSFLFCFTLTLIHIFNTNWIFQYAS